MSAGFKVSIPEISSGAIDTFLALASAATKTLIQLAPASNKDFQLVEVTVACDGTTGTNWAGVPFFLVTQSTAGTGGRSETPIKVRGGGSTTSAITTLTAADAWSAEPTYVDMIKILGCVNPSSGLLVVQYPLGREPIVIGGGNRLALVYKSPTLATPPNVFCSMEWDE